MSIYSIRQKLDKELGGYKIDGVEFREMWGLFDLVVKFLDEQLEKKEEEVLGNLKRVLQKGFSPDIEEYVFEELDNLKSQTKK